MMPFRAVRRTVERGIEAVSSMAVSKAHLEEVLG